MRRCIALLMGGLMAVTLSGCQSLSRPVSVLPKTVAAPAAPVVPKTVVSERVTPLVRVQVSCEGGVGCTFIRVDGLEVDQYRAHQTINASGVGYQDQGQEAVNLRQQVWLSEGVHELKLDFYPMQPDRAEQFKLIHHFKSGQPYRLRQYFLRPTRAASVLDQAQPDPLCVDVLQGEQVLRRFCRPHDVSSGLGEFVERKL